MMNINMRLQAMDIRAITDAIEGAEAAVAQMQKVLERTVTKLFIDELRLAIDELRWATLAPEDYRNDDKILACSKEVVSIIDAILEDTHFGSAESESGYSLVETDRMARELIHDIADRCGYDGDSLEVALAEIARAGELSRLRLAIDALESVVNEEMTGEK